MQTQAVHTRHIALLQASALGLLSRQPARRRQARLQGMRRRGMRQAIACLQARSQELWTGKALRPLMQRHRWPPARQARQVRPVLRPPQRTKLPWRQLSVCSTCTAREALRQLLAAPTPMGSPHQQRQCMFSQQARHAHRSMWLPAVGHGHSLCNQEARAQCILVLMQCVAQRASKRLCSWTGTESLRPWGCRGLLSMERSCWPTRVGC